MPELLPDSFADLTSLRPFSKIRLIAFDLDGTLLPQDSVVKFQQLSRSLRRRGVRLVVATGRALGGVEPLLDQLALPGTLLVLYNGSVVLERTSLAVVAHRTIPSRAVRAAIALGVEEGLRSSTYYFRDPLRGTAELFGTREAVVGWPGRNLDSLPKLEFNGLKIRWAESLTDVPEEPATAILFQLDGDAERTARVRKRLRSIPELSTTQSGPHFLEVKPRGSDKAVALAEVAHALGVERSDVLAVGDNDNDAEMLHWAGIGIAISKASKLALESADYVCRRGTFSGVIEMLRIVRDAKRFYP